MSCTRIWFSTGIGSQGYLCKQMGVNGMKRLGRHPLQAPPDTSQTTRRGFAAIPQNQRGLFDFFFL